ncbi:MAG: hypothetical protein QW040_02525 [Candidatus Aenigmatarchaeota archaeon]
MKFKHLVAIAVILTATGFLLFTEQGKKYAISLGGMTRNLTSMVGGFLASFIKIPPKGEFNFELELNKEAAYKQSFSFSNAGFECSCRILNLIIDGKIWEVGDKIRIEMVGDGEVLIGNEGKLILKADASSIKFDSWKTSKVKVEIEMIPENFFLSNAKAKLLNMTSVSGTMSKEMEDLKIKVDFEQANLKLEGFNGSVKFEEKLRLEGTATDIEINGKRV